MVKEGNNGEGNNGDSGNGEANGSKPENAASIAAAAAAAACHRRLQEIFEHHLRRLTINSPGSNQGAIDIRIEQAMDLVKSHLMSAVRNEVEELKARIVRLEYQIASLKEQNDYLYNASSEEHKAHVDSMRARAQDNLDQFDATNAAVARYQVQVTPGGQGVPFRATNNAGYVFRPRAPCQPQSNSAQRVIPVYLAPPHMGVRVAPTLVASETQPTAVPVANVPAAPSRQQSQPAEQPQQPTQDNEVTAAPEEQPEVNTATAEPQQ